LTTINSEVYQALMEAGASEEKARAAAESVNAETSRLASIQTNLTRIETNVNWLKQLTLISLGFFVAITAKVYGLI
jgi:hypothetical protein|tara:strand:- start:218 stop:445 length:228 start_codon:yes stop_codon:yes gene_type:complete